MTLMEHKEPGMFILVEDFEKITVNGFQVIRTDYGKVTAMKGEVATLIFREKLQVIAGWELLERYIEVDVDQVERDPRGMAPRRLEELFKALRNLASEIAVRRTK